MSKEVIVLSGSGTIGIAIVRRIAVGKVLLLADLKIENAEKQAQELRNAGFNVHTIACDVSNRESVNKLVETATGLGKIMGLVNTAGVSPYPPPKRLHSEYLKSIYTVTLCYLTHLVG
jgi:NAD(P)-dependent dehydrogenase (short-subunit alcohol dehydrogenase family)